MAVRYQIQNTTKKPKPPTGPDTRSLIERNGCFVQYRDTRGNNVMLGVGGVKIVNDLTEDHIALIDQGHMSAVEIKDIAQALKKHAGPAPKRGVDAKLGTDIEDQRSGKKHARVGKAALMGETQNATGISELEQVPEYEGAVNPDGTPNFTFTAKKNALPKRQRR